MALGVMEVEINVASLTDSLKAATLSSEEYEGLLAEKHKVEARLQEYCVKADQLVDMALAVGETGEVTKTMTEAKDTPEGEELCDNGQVKTAKDNAQFEEETETNTEEVEDVYQEIPKGEDDEIHGEVGDNLGGSFREESDRRGSLRGYLGGGQCGLHPEEGGGLCGGVWLYQDSDTAAEDELEVLSQAKQPVEVTAKAKLERAGSLRAATHGRKEHEGHGV